MVSQAKLILPPGYKTGCLPRKSRFGEVCDPLEKAIEIIPVDRWQKLIGEVDLRPKTPDPPYDQNGYGSCACESSSGSVETVRVAAGLPRVRLNPYFVYHTTSGGRDNGSNIDDNLVFVREHGIAPESVWPRSHGPWKTPSAEAKKEALKYRILEFYDIANWEEFGTALLLGFPVVFGYSGHSVLATSLIDENRLEYLNSWGNWGDQGFGVLRSSSIMWQYGAWAVRSVIAPDLTAPIGT